MNSNRRNRIAWLFMKKMVELETNEWGENFPNSPLFIKLREVGKLSFEDVSEEEKKDFLGWLITF